MAKKSIDQVDSSIIVKDDGATLVKIKIILSNGECETKTITFDDYCQWLLGAKEERRSYVHVNEERPQYFFDGCLSNETGCFRVQLFVPKEKHQMVSKNFDFAESITYPALLFDLTFEKSKPTRKCVYALKVKDAKDIKPDTPLYRYPYGNVSSDGSICMGNIAVKCEFSESSKFVEEFFLGIDEGHYYQPKVMISKAWNLGRLYNEALKKGDFLNSWLVSNGKTYKNIMYK